MFHLLQFDEFVERLYLATMLFFAGYVESQLHTRDAEPSNTERYQIQEQDKMSD
jgi:hypothetical protein